MIPFHFKSYQIEDIARAAMKDAAILAWEPGMGKTLAAFAWPLLKQARRVLLVAPESLHQQMREVGSLFFGVAVRPLPDQAAWTRWKLGRPAKVSTGKPTFYITSYHQLGMNGGDEWLQRDGVPEALRRRRRQFITEHGLPANPLYWHNIGAEMDGIRCVFLPTLSTLIREADSFDCVVVDEGTRLQGDDSYLAEGVRQLSPQYRLLLSATPIKNRLPSLFWLASWVGQGLGETVWPYPASEAGKRQFATTHLERDKHHTRALEQKRKPAYRTTARICNQHHLWRQLSPLILRRRKTDCGEQIVPKVVKPIWVHPSPAQLARYRWAIQNPPMVTKAGDKPSPMSQAVMQLAILRQICLCPDSPNLDHPPGLPEISPLTPKMEAILALVKECRSRGEQVVIGSTFQHFATSAVRLLRQRGLRTLLLDGREKPETRALLSQAFKKGNFHVMVAGLSSMGEGHSWECCPNLILPSLEWSYDLNEQFVHRVWRINSPKPVTIYPVLIKGTVDERLFSLYREKDDASRLSLDGEFADKEQDEVDFEDFVKSLAQPLCFS